MKLESKKPDNDQNPFWSALLAVLPYLPVAASIATYRYLNLEYVITERIQMFTIAAFLALVFVGWMRGFPAWCFPYLSVVFGIFLALWIGSDSDMTFWENLGWKITMLGPVMLVFLIFWYFNRRRFPLRRLVEAVRRDWTLISFAVYSLLILVIHGLFSDIRSTYGAPYLLLSTFIAMTGSALYVLLRSQRGRFTALVVCFSLCWLAAGYGSATFWHGRREDWMSAPANGLVYARGYLTAWAIMLVLMCLPPLVLWIKLAFRQKFNPLYRPL